VIDVNYDKSIATIKLNRGVTNALNLEMVQDLAKVLENLRINSDVRALVLGSSNEKFFSIGFDIPNLFELSQNDFSEFYKAFNQACMALYTLPKPTVACLTGHAIAGGCILALCCDYRVIGEGRKLMGLNEIKLGVPVPYLADCILQSIVGKRTARDVVEYGEFFESEVSLKKGLVDEVVPQSEVMTRAMEKAEVLSLMPPAAYQGIKKNRVEDVETRIRSKWEAQQRDFVELWYSEDARKRLREAMEKF
jgi:enoyl-CoA hydratase/carnithine racemase